MDHMNAVALNKVKKPRKYKQIIENPNYILEEKLKGIRAFVHLNYGLPNYIVSKGGHDISHRVPHIRDWETPKDLDSCVLDGELYQEGVEDEIIAGWCNHNTQFIDAGVTKDVKLYIFDILKTHFHGFLIEEPLAVRKRILYDLREDYEEGPFYLLPWWANEEVEARFEEILKKGGEGLMLKNLEGLYNPGTRLEHNWYKLKGHQDFDVVIVGFEDAKELSIKKGDTEETPTKFSGLIGAFKYGMYDKGFLMELGTCTGMDMKTRESMTFNPEEWLFSVVELRGVEQKKSGAIDNPRFRRRRLDKTPKECIWIHSYASPA